MIETLEECTPKSLPALGPWMLNSQGEPANWFLYLHKGKELREPINIILVDGSASSKSQAKQRLLRAMRQAGYPSRRGHSDGYLGLIAGRQYPQLPRAKGHSFSDRPYFLPNNHGRIFGPAPYYDSFVFVGAFSREGVAPFARVKHPYHSFNTARDHLAAQLHAKSIYKIRCKIDLENAMTGHPSLTTGDHDGYAILLEA